MDRNFDEKMDRDLDEIREVVSQESMADGEKKAILDQRGMSTVEIILILVVLIALVVIFKDQITALVNNIFSSINKSASSIY